MPVVLITGTSSGFGLQSAVRFAEQGHTVIATMRDLSRRSALQQALDAAAVSAEVMQLDVTDANSRSVAIEGAISKFGSIDVLVNNAGVAHLGPIEELPLDDFRLMYETNVFGPTELMKLVLPAMRDRGTGRIVNVTSIGAVLAPAFLSAYCSTKHALDAISRGMDLELTPFGIRVVSIAPGGYNTNIYRRNAYFFDPETTSHPRANELTGAIRSSIESVDDFSPVVNAIFEAATAENPSVRYAVGDGMPTLALGLVTEGERVHEQLRSNQFPDSNS